MTLSQRFFFSPAPTLDLLFRSLGIVTRLKCVIPNQFNGSTLVGIARKRPRLMICQSLFHIVGVPNIIRAVRTFQHVAMKHPVACHRFSPIITAALSSSRATTASVEGRPEPEKRPSTFTSAQALVAQDYGDFSTSLFSFEFLPRSRFRPLHRVAIQERRRLHVHACLRRRTPLPSGPTRHWRPRVGR